MESTICLDNLHQREQTVRRDRTITIALRSQAGDRKWVWRGRQTLLIYSPSNTKA
jgi:hypothetical protein